MDAQHLVREAEAAHAAMDIERVMACFEVDIVASWNGRPLAHGHDALRAWYTKFFARQHRFAIQKTLRAVDGNVLAVEWTHQRTDHDGRSFEAFGAEFWFVTAAGRLREWHAYCSDYPL